MLLIDALWICANTLCNGEGKCSNLKLNSADRDYLIQLICQTFQRYGFESYYLGVVQDGTLLKPNKPRISNGLLAFCFLQKRSSRASISI